MIIFAKVRTNNSTYRFFQYVTVAFLALLLGWLTVSAPFVYKAQQQWQQQKKAIADLGSSEEESSPLTSSTEEKTANSNSLSEYLHEQHCWHGPQAGLISHAPDAEDDTYLAFHGELLVPPPEA